MREPVIRVIQRPDLMIQCLFVQLVLMGIWPNVRESGPNYTIPQCPWTGDILTLVEFAHLKAGPVGAHLQAGRKQYHQPIESQ